MIPAEERSSDQKYTPEKRLNVRNIMIINSTALYIARPAKKEMKMRSVSESPLYPPVTPAPGDAKSGPDDVALLAMVMSKCLGLTGLLGAKKRGCGLQYLRIFEYRVGSYTEGLETC